MKRFVNGVAAVTLGLVAGFLSPGKSAGATAGHNRGPGRQSGGPAQNSGHWTVQPSPSRGGKLVSNVQPPRVRPPSVRPGKGWPAYDYHRLHGKKFRHGYYYRGRNHNHWSKKVWSPRHRCYLYLDPGLNRYFYWCQPAGCYFPMDYCPYGRYDFPDSADDDSPPDDPSNGDPVDDQS